MVNRIWQHHFGDGIVRTPNNFGKLGTPPTHPELLDQLAVEFIKSGWSIKAMHRAMMLSATYQQSSETDAQTFRADPDNLLLGRNAPPEARCRIPARLDAHRRRQARHQRGRRRDQRPEHAQAVAVRHDDPLRPRELPQPFDAADAQSHRREAHDSTVAPQALFS
jgi:hypothetical protein